jgi:ATP-dependent DNA ligase
MDKEELRKLYRGSGEMILCGEYMNKSKKDENEKVWNQKYVIWDIIMYDGEHLINTTFEYRQYLLMALYSLCSKKKLLHQISENCFRVDFVKKNFLEIYQEITKYDMYEGLVLKKIDGKLENGYSEKNNIKTQIKCRKGTKNYIF